MVDFCPSCGSIIMGKKGSEIKCGSCGYLSKAQTTITLSEKIEEKKEIEIISDDVETKVNPLIETECPKCKHDKAYYYSKQMRAGDEPETLFYTCEKCGHKWRDYR